MKHVFESMLYNTIAGSLTSKTETFFKLVEMIE